jgi:hypothetical protein
VGSLRLLLICGLLVVSAAGCNSKKDSAGDGGQAVTVELNQVNLKMYSKGTQIGELVAPKLRLDERNQILTAPAGVEARLAPEAWEQQAK